MDSKFIADSYFWLKSGFGCDFGQYDTKTIKLRRFLARHLLERASPWQQLMSKVFKNCLRGSVDTKSHKFSASYT